MFRCLFFLAILASPLLASKINFKADHYQRDFAKRTTIANGNAWLQFGDLEIFADEMEIDQARNLAIAKGNVRIKDANIEIWCDYANYNLAGEDAVMENTVLTSGTTTLTGTIVKRISRKRYVVEEGTYSNCNVDRLRGEEAANCVYDWKFYGKRLTVDVDEYVHVTDAIAHIKGLPVIYVPYFFLPIKKERESGLLLSSMGYTANLGTRITFPYFLALSDWHDLTLTPSLHTKRGIHLGLSYRYVYTPKKKGNVDIFLLQRRFSANRADPSPPGNRERTLGLVGEAAIHLENQFDLWGRAYTRQSIYLASDPFYLFDYSDDLAVSKNLASLRSLFYFTWPGDNMLLTAEVRHHQSMIISEDTGVDRGEVTRLPSISYSLSSQPLLNSIFLFEAQLNVTNFFRPAVSYDSVSLTLDKSAAVHSDPDPSFHVGNYIREGQRLHVEPKLVANLPFFTGIQVQPTLFMGALVYHFDTPSSEVIGRTYADFEFPASLYISKHFKTSIPGYESITHVIQPRVIYATRFYRGGASESDHPFFYSDESRNLSNPRFDLLDQLPEFEYMRFELINRLRRRTENGVERFLLLQLSNQYNFRTNTALDINKTAFRRLGPLELLGEFRFWRFSAQIEAEYFLETIKNSSGEFVRESDWSSSISYLHPGGDRITIGSRFKSLADSSLNEQTALLSAYKTLPILFDISGNIEYSLLTGDLVRYHVALYMGTQKPNCWSLQLAFGENELSQTFVNLDFKLDFGGV